MACNILALGMATSNTPRGGIFTIDGCEGTGVSGR